MCALCTKKEKLKWLTINLARVRQFAEFYSIMDVTRPVMECFGEIKAFLTQLGKTIDDFDLLIGCTALTMNYAVVTNNTKHYARIPELKVVNWA